MKDFWKRWVEEYEPILFFVLLFLVLTGAFALVTWIERVI